MIAPSGVYYDPFHGTVGQPTEIDRSTSVYHAAVTDVREWAYVHLMAMANETRLVAHELAAAGKERAAMLQMSAASAYRHAAMDILINQDLTDGRAGA